MWIDHALALLRSGDLRRYINIEADGDPSGYGG
jgi:hypothetical protein